MQKDGEPILSCSLLHFLEFAREHLCEAFYHSVFVGGLYFNCCDRWIAKSSCRLLLLHFLECDIVGASFQVFDE